MDAAIQVLVYLLLPWALGFYVLHKQQQKQIYPLWFALLGLFLVPIGIWKESTSAASHLADYSLKRVGDTLLHLFRYILPFTAYPLIVFWLKLMVNQRADDEETGDNQMKLRNPKMQRVQARLITFAIKVMVMVFVFFELLNRVGIETSEVLQIGTVFSLGNNKPIRTLRLALVSGLSWSMRDWLSSLWASFMIAFTTELSVDSQIILGTALPPNPVNPTNPANSAPGVSNPWMRVIKTGLIFTVCNNAKGGADVYIPNSTLVAGGFVIQ
ncbi:MAG: hypothetical protein CL504_09600 [Actinobacteria bacterium]|nr:hypothetical protein [Actinomycetota bacterium]